MAGSRSSLAWTDSDGVCSLLLPFSETESSDTCQLFPRREPVALLKGMRTVPSCACGDRPSCREPRSLVLSGRVKVSVLCFSAWLSFISYSGFEVVTGEYADVFLFGGARPRALLCLASPLCHCDITIALPIDNKFHHIVEQIFSFVRVYLSNRRIVDIYTHEVQCVCRHGATDCPIFRANFESAS